MNRQTFDYSITWAYIVSEMEQKFGIKPDSDEKFSFIEIEQYIKKICDEYVDKLDEYHKIKQLIRMAEKVLDFEENPDKLMFAINNDITQRLMNMDGGI